MKIVLNNKADLSNKYARYVKWKTYKLQEKFSSLHYANIYFKKANNQSREYILTVELGVTGPDIVIRKKSDNVKKLINNYYKIAHKELAKLSNK